MLSQYRRPKVDVESVERALNNAKRNGWVERWQRHPEGGHIVYIRRWGPERFKTNRETYAFTLGLAAVDCNPEEEGGSEIAASRDLAREALAAAREHATATGRPLGVSVREQKEEGESK